MKRFYKCVDVAQTADGFAVQLDGRSIKSPGKRMLSVLSRALADAVADEWRAQDTEVKPETMLMTRHVNAALDRVGPSRSVIIADLAGYANSDQLCYRADAPEELVLRQQQKWDPLLDWAADELGMKLVLNSGIIHKDQPAAAIERAKALLVVCDDVTLAALHTLISISGSFVIGMAALKGRIDAAQCLELALLDELYQAEVWGSDSFAEKRRSDLKAEIDAAHMVLTLVSVN